jgi:hypothetical protein
MPDEQVPCLGCHQGRCRIGQSQAVGREQSPIGVEGPADEWYQERAAADTPAIDDTCAVPPNYCPRSPYVTRTWSPYDNGVSCRTPRPCNHPCDVINDIPGAWYLDAHRARDQGLYGIVEGPQVRRNEPRRNLVMHPIPWRSHKAGPADYNLRNIGHDVTVAPRCSIGLDRPGGTGYAFYRVEHYLGATGVRGYRLRH